MSWYFSEFNFDFPFQSTETALCIGAEAGKQQCNRLFLQLEFATGGVTEQSGGPIGVTIGRAG